MYLRAPFGQCKIENVPWIEVKWHWIVSQYCVGGGGGECRLQMAGEMAGGWKDGTLLLLEPVKKNGCSVEGWVERDNGISKEICGVCACKKKMEEG